MTTPAAPVLSLAEAERLAELLLEGLSSWTTFTVGGDGTRRWLVADRERVASDLAGIRRHHTETDVCAVDWLTWPCADARRYSDGLKRTAALYGVTVESHPRHPIE